MTSTIEAAACAATMRLIASPQRGPFGLTDIFEHDAWVRLFAERLGLAALRGTLRGAIAGLSSQGAIPYDIAHMLPPGEYGAVTIQDFELARRWMVEGLSKSDGAGDAVRDASIYVTTRGWELKAVRISSLTLAILILSLYTAPSVDRPTSR